MKLKVRGTLQRHCWLIFPSSRSKCYCHYDRSIKSKPSTAISYKTDHELNCGVALHLGLESACRGRKRWKIHCYRSRIRKLCCELFFFSFSSSVVWNSLDRFTFDLIPSTCLGQRRCPCVYILNNGNPVQLQSSSPHTWDDCLRPLISSSWRRRRKCWGIIWVASLFFILRSKQLQIYLTWHVRCKAATCLLIILFNSPPPPAAAHKVHLDCHNHREDDELDWPTAEWHFMKRLHQLQQQLEDDERSSGRCEDSTCNCNCKALEMNVALDGQLCGSGSYYKMLQKSQECFSHSRWSLLRKLVIYYWNSKTMTPKLYKV